MAREIRTRYEDSTCIRCDKRFDKGDRVMHARPIGVWCVERCIPEFPEPEGDMKLALGILERLESEERLKGYTRGILERYRVTGRMSDAHIETLLPQDTVRRELLRHPHSVPPTLEDLGYTNQGGHG